MKLDITPILCGDEKELPFKFTENVSGEADIYFKGLDMVPAGSISANGRIYDLSGLLQLDMEASLPCTVHCARCGKEVSYVCKAELHRIVSSNGNGDDDDRIVYSDRFVELDSPVCEELSISFPSRILCRPDCKGLCPVCGQDLNEGRCEHSDIEEENDTL